MELLIYFAGILTGVLISLFTVWIAKQDGF